MRARVMFGAVLLLLPLSVADLVHARHGGQAGGDARLGSQAEPVATEEEQGRLLATGKKIFVERCAKCHDEHGDKPLKTGLPLNQRKLSDEEIASTVSGRLKDAPDEEKRAVALYISSFMKRK
jgi:mono/diheme cytochrome c family protein